MSDENIAQTVEQLTERAQQPQELNGVPFMVLSSSQSVTSLEKYLDHPRRAFGTFDAGDIPSFITIVKQRKRDSSRFELLDQSRFRVVVNARSGDQSEWEDDIVEFRFRHSAAFLIWRMGGGDMMSAKRFAEFIEDNRLDVHQVMDGDRVVSPSAADMIDLARNIRGKANVEFSEDIDEMTGARGASYSETITLSGGQKGNLEIPGSFVIAIEIFEGDTERTPINVIMRCRVHDGKVQFSYKLDLLDDVVKKVFEKHAEHVQKEIGMSPVRVA